MQEKQFLTCGKTDVASFKNEDDYVNWIGKSAIESDVDELLSESKAFGDENKDAVKVAFVISDESEDRARDTVSQKGLDLKHYKSNPVVLFGHDHNTPAIGKGVGTHLGMDGKTRSVTVFVPKDVNAFAGMIGELYKKDFMRAVSIGFYGKESARSGDGFHFAKSELIEYSAVNVPSNRNALAEGKSAGVDVSPAKEYLSQWLDENFVSIEREAFEVWWKSVSPQTVFSFGAMQEAFDNVQREALRLKREEARSPIVIDYKAAFVALAKDTKATNVQRYLDSVTFHKSDVVEIAETAQATEKELSALVEEKTDNENAVDPKTSQLPTVDDRPPANATKFVELFSNFLNH